MTTEPITETVRIQWFAASPIDADDILVEVLEDGEWRLKNRFNSMRDDFAYTRARSTAYRLAGLS